MPGENTGTGEAQAPAAGTSQPPEGAPAGGQAPQQPPAAGDGQQAGGGTESDTARIARLERELAETRREAAGHRTKAAALERAQAEAAQAGMSEAEKAAARAAAAEDENKALKAQLEEQSLRSAALEAATRLGYRNPDVAYRLLDRAQLERNAEGQPKNVEKLLRELLAAEPYLGKGAGADFGGGNRGGTPGANGQPGMNELLKAALGGG